MASRSTARAMHWLQRSALKSARERRLRMVLREVYARARLHNNAEQTASDLAAGTSWARLCRLEPFSVGSGVVVNNDVPYYRHRHRGMLKQPVRHRSDEGAFDGADTTRAHHHGVGAMELNHLGQHMRRVAAANLACPFDASHREQRLGRLECMCAGFGADLVEHVGVVQYDHLVQCGWQLNIGEHETRRQPVVHKLKRMSYCVKRRFGPINGKQNLEHECAPENWESGKCSGLWARMS